MFKKIRYDLLSSIVVFLVALPLCLGISLASNAPLSAGLFAGIIGGIVVGFCSGSHVSVSGPAAGLTVIVLNGISELGSFNAFTLAVLLSGIFQLIFCLLKAGQVGNYFPSSVIKGMLAAIGYILIIKQLPIVVGLPPDWDFSHLISLMKSGILIISAASLAIMIFWESMAQRGISFFKLIPGALVAVLVSIVLEFIYKFYFPALTIGEELLVHLPFHGGFEEILSFIHIPDFSRIFDIKVIQVGLTIAIVGSIETLLSLDAAEKIDPEKRLASKNRELFAQGIGNALSGFVGGLPITAVIVRTSANLSAGSKTKLSSIFHGIWIFACIDLIPDLLNFIPLASLACILLMTGYKLSKPMHFIEMKKRGNDQLFIFSSTIIAILSTDLLKGIIIGIVCALVLELRKMKRDPYRVTAMKEELTIEFLDYVSFIHKSEIGKLLSPGNTPKSVHLKNFSRDKCHIDVFEMILSKKEELEDQQITIRLT